MLTYSIEAMGLASSSGPMYFAEDEDDDDDSDLEDTNLSSDDALIVVAKTEEVSFSFPLIFILSMSVIS